MIKSMLKFEEAIFYYKKYLQLNPNNSQAHVYIGNAFSTIASFYQPNISRLMKLKSDTSYYYECITAADEHFKHAIDLDSLNAQAFVEYGHFLSNQKKYKEAIIKFQKALQIDSTYAYAYAEYAFTLFILSDYDKSQKYIDKVLKLNPDNAYVYGTYGINLYIVNRKSEAIDYLSKAIDLNPYYHSFRNFLVSIFRSSDSNEKIKNLYEKLFNKGISSMEIYLEYAKELKEQSDFKLAIEYIKKAINLNPDNLEIYYDLADNYFALNNTENVISDLENIINKAKNSDVIFFSIGEKLYKKNSLPYTFYNSLNNFS